MTSDVDSLFALHDARIRWETTERILSLMSRTDDLNEAYRAVSIMARSLVEEIRQLRGEEN
jgi:hypothetical protein